MVCFSTEPQVYATLLPIILFPDLQVFLNVPAWAFTQLHQLVAHLFHIVDSQSH